MREGERENDQRSCLVDPCHTQEKDDAVKGRDVGLGPGKVCRVRVEERSIFDSLELGDDAVERRTGGRVGTEHSRGLGDDRDGLKEELDLALVPDARAWRNRALIPNQQRRMK